MVETSIAVVAAKIGVEKMEDMKWEIEYHFECSFFFENVFRKVSALVCSLISLPLHPILQFFFLNF